MADVPHYQYKHIAWQQREKTWLVSAIKGRPTMLGRVVVNTGGRFTLTLYNGTADDNQQVAVITNPNAGQTLIYECVLDQGIGFSVRGAHDNEANPYSITITYFEV